ncbi:putative FAD linked oxidase [Magnetofaba australis IT-1]|uniref:Putative FAD linked oxidase n=1 Tax=Magnetofaba australis IT-1 TaxID=1434232 RepID=A0A1Y2K1Q2_9PROT|nr:putative FAD linked oxidase [Magnetofaba australis IT-1]
MQTERLNRFLAWDPMAGLLTLEAGATLSEVIEFAAPRGFFPRVAPGTRLLSIGGAIAADVHGKNHHHMGSFGSHVSEIELTLASGETVVCSPREDAELFWATVGGMGLTGFIRQASIQLQPIDSVWVSARHYPCANLDEAFRIFEDPLRDDQHTVAWVDALASGPNLGRSVVMAGHHAVRDELPPHVADNALALKPKKERNFPLDLPAWALNPLSVKMFNALYYKTQAAKTAPFVCDIESFFFPLDAIGQWHRLYGKRGFAQFQCLIPRARAHEGVREILERAAKARKASFLSVLKRLGPGNPAPLSFPDDGYTLTLDLPYNDKLPAFLGELTDRLTSYGGRLYLAKDAFATPEQFRIGYPQFDQWLAVKQRVDPEWRIRSALSQRLGMEVGQ